MDIAWPWSGEAAPVARLAREIAARGYAVIRGDAVDLAPAEAARSPWSYAERLVGKEPARPTPICIACSFEAPRRVPFVLGDVFGPTVAERGGALAFTHAPFVARGDSIAHRLAPFVEAAPTLVFATRAGEILVADNRRMLHGRRAFTGAREYVRLLIWTRGALPGSDEEVWGYLRS